MKQRHTLILVICLFIQDALSMRFTGDEDCSASSSGLIWEPETLEARFQEVKQPLLEYAFEEALLKIASSPDSEPRPTSESSFTLASNPTSRPSCFITYAQEDCKEVMNQVRQARIYFEKVGAYVYDLWSTSPGTFISRFIENIRKSDKVILFGSQTLRLQYDTRESRDATNMEISQIFTELRHHQNKIIPVLLEGSPETSFPSFLDDVTHLDLRNPTLYFTQVFKLVENILPRKVEAISSATQEFKRFEGALDASLSIEEKQNFILSYERQKREQEELDRKLAKKIANKFLSKRFLSLGDFLSSESFSLQDIKDIKNMKEKIKEKKSRLKEEEIFKSFQGSEFADNKSLTHEIKTLPSKEKIRYVNLKGCSRISMSGIYAVVSLCPNLQYLNLSGLKKLTYISIPEKVLKERDNDSYLSSDEEEDDLLNAPSLEELKLNNLDNLEIFHLRAPHLKVLEIRNARSLKGVRLELPALAYVNITNEDANEGVSRAPSFERYIQKWVCRPAQQSTRSIKGLSPYVRIVAQGDLHLARRQASEALNLYLNQELAGNFRVSLDLQPILSLMMDAGRNGDLSACYIIGLLGGMIGAGRLYYEGQNRLEVQGRYHAQAILGERRGEAESVFDTIHPGDRRLILERILTGKIKNMGEVEVVEEDPDRALEILEPLIEKYPSSKLEKARILERSKGNIQEAGALYQELVAQDPNSPDPDAIVHLMVLIARKKFDASLFNYSGSDLEMLLPLALAQQRKQKQFQKILQRAEEYQVDRYTIQESTIYPINLKQNGIWKKILWVEQRWIKEIGKFLGALSNCHWVTILGDGNIDTTFILSLPETLEYLDLTNCEIDKKKITILKNQFDRLKNLKHLNLSFNQLREEEIKELAQTLPKLPLLQFLGLSYNHIRDLSELAPLLPPSLIALDLSYNKINFDAARILAENLPRSMEFLDLSATFLNYHDIIALGSLLRKKNPSLKERFEIKSFETLEMKISEMASIRPYSKIDSEEDDKAARDENQIQFLENSKKGTEFLKLWFLAQVYNEEMRRAAQNELAELARGGNQEALRNLHFLAGDKDDELVMREAQDKLAELVRGGNQEALMSLKFLAQDSFLTFLPEDPHTKVVRRAAQDKLAELAREGNQKALKILETLGMCKYHEAVRIEAQDKLVELARKGNQGTLSNLKFLAGHGYNKVVRRAAQDKLAELVSVGNLKALSILGSLIRNSYRVQVRIIRLVHTGVLEDLARTDNQWALMILKILLTLDEFSYDEVVKREAHKGLIKLLKLLGELAGEGSQEILKSLKLLARGSYHEAVRIEAQDELIRLMELGVLGKLARENKYEALQSLVFLVTGSHIATVRREAQDELIKLIRIENFQWVLNNLSALRIYPYNEAIRREVRDKLIALAKGGHRRALIGLAKYSYNEVITREVRDKLAELAREGDQEALSSLETLARDSDNETIRREARDKLVELVREGNQKALSSLEALARTLGNEIVRREARGKLVELVREGNQKALSSLESLAGSLYEVLKEEALGTLVELAEEGNQKALKSLQLLGKYEYISYHYQKYAYLQQKVLIELLYSGVLEELAREGNHEALSNLEALAETLYNKTVGRKARDTLVKLAREDNQKALSSLETLAGTLDNEAVRREAQSKLVELVREGNQKALSSLKTLAATIHSKAVSQESQDRLAELAREDNHEALMSLKFLVEALDNVAGRRALDQLTGLAKEDNQKALSSLLDLAERIDNEALREEAQDKLIELAREGNQKALSNLKFLAENSHGEAVRIEVQNKLVELFRQN